MDEQAEEQSLAEKLIAQLGESTLFALLTALDDGVDVYDVVCDELHRSKPEVLHRFLAAPAEAVCGGCACCNCAIE